MRHTGIAHPYIVVEHAGTDDECVVVSYSTYAEAARYVTNRSAGRELDVMKLDANGSPTTEL